MFFSSKRLKFIIRAVFVRTSRQYRTGAVVEQRFCRPNIQILPQYNNNNIKLIFGYSCRGASTMLRTETDDRLVWIDCEMSGLDAAKCHLLEVACLITDGDLNIIAEGPNIIIYQSDEVLEVMDEWCTNQHSKSGLTQRVRSSKVSLCEAEDELLSFVRAHTDVGKSVLAGNSVHADKRFLDKYMGRLMSHLHYRIVDVSTVKELCRALSDIRESIAELNYYRRVIFKRTEDKDVN